MSGAASGLVCDQLLLGPECCVTAAGALSLKYHPLQPHRKCTVVEGVCALCALARGLLAFTLPRCHTFFFFFMWRPRTVCSCVQYYTILYISTSRTPGIPKDVRLCSFSGRDMMGRGIGGGLGRDQGQTDDGLVPAAGRPPAVSS